MWPRVFIGLFKKKKKGWGGVGEEESDSESVLLSAVYLSELIQVDVPLCVFACVFECAHARVSLRHQMRLQPRGTWMSDV